MTATLAPEVAEALDVARRLVYAGVPVFVAAPDPSKKIGFALPTGWQQTGPDARVVDLWQPGMALCAVMGCGLDLIDVDPRSGGDLAALEGRLPYIYATAVTPSGGVHAFVRSLGVGSRDGVLPGVDIKAGDTEGKGRGFAFIAPTVRASKVTGELAAYRWIQPANLDALAPIREGVYDPTGAGLRELVLAARSKDHSAGTVDEFMKAGPWSDIPATLAGGRNNGVAKLAASLRGRGGLLLEDALDVMYRRVWPLLDQSQGGHEFTADEFEQTIRAAWRQYPDGGEQRAAEAEVPPVLPDGSLQPPSPARYFGQGGLLAQTLSADAALLGPLAEGADDRMWHYHHGVWLPDKDVVRDRSAWLMGDRYRGSHARTAEDVVRALYSAKLRCDPIPDLINFRNGLLHWRTGELRPHTPDVLTTVQLEVEWQPDAECPAFERFLSEVVPADMVETVWELVGYLMYSGNPLHKAVMLTGTGRNGKGTFIHVIEALLGRRNYTTVSLHDLVNTRFSTASLFGKLANLAGDIDGGYLENTATFKGITGGDTISAEHKGRDRFDFTPWAVPVFSANKIPASADTTVGYLSRWLVVPFPNSFTGREDRTLGQRLTTDAELRGIAARGVRALPALLDRGDFVLTESAASARDEFVRRVDQVRAWIDEGAELCEDPDGFPFVPRTQLYAAYQGWAMRDGHRAVRASEFYDRIEAAGAWPVTLHGTRGFKRIRLRNDGGMVAPSWVQVPAAADPTTTDSSQEPQSVTEITDLPAPSKNAGQTANDPRLGAEGAVHPHPPSRGRTQEKVGEDRHPLHPRSTSDPETRSTSSPVQDAKTAAKAAAKAEAIRAAVEAAAGPRHPLPAVVDRDGTVVPVGLELAAQVLTRYADDLTVDVETTGYPIGHEHYALRTVQLGGADLSAVLDPHDDPQRQVIADALVLARKLRAHSATADLVPLDHAELLVRGAEDAWSRMHDTVIPAKLADPQSTGSDPALKQLAPAVLGDEAVSPAADAVRAAVFKAGKWLTEVEATTPVARSGWAQIASDSEAMLVYAASDVLDTALLAQRLPVLPQELLDRERAVEAVTARIAHVGLPLDRDTVERLHGEWTEHKHVAVETLLDRHEIKNGASSTQVIAAAQALGIQLPRTKPTKTKPEGGPSAAKGALEPYANGFAGTPEQQQFARDVLAHRTASNRLSLFLDDFRQFTQRGDGRVRTTIYTLAADTGRMSSVRKNLQQIPREGGFRSCITADIGYSLVSADLAGVELRAAAALSQDPALISVITDPNATSANKADLHWLVTKQVFGPEATKAHRYAVKRGVFGWLYGGGAQTLAEHMGATVPIAQAMIDTLTQMFPTLVAWTQQVRNAVKAGLRSFTAYNGRVVHFNSPHSAPNYCIQGTARELLVEAILRWDDAVPLDLMARPIVLPVHDEIVTMVPEHLAQQATSLLVECMTSELFGVPIKAEPSEPAFAWQDSV